MLMDGCIGFEAKDLAGDVIGTASGMGKSLMVATRWEPLLLKVSRAAVAVASRGVALAGLWWGEGLCGDEVRFHFLLKGCDRLLTRKVPSFSVLFSRGCCPTGFSLEGLQVKMPLDKGLKSMVAHAPDVLEGLKGYGGRPLANAVPSFPVLVVHVVV
jgi:hypothetical protein